MKSIRTNNFLLVMPIVLIISGCYVNKPFQPPSHPAEQWLKNGEPYNFNTVLKNMEDCGWVKPRDNLDANGKVRLELYSIVDRCMTNKGYTSRVPPKAKTRLF